MVEWGELKDAPQDTGDADKPHPDHPNCFHCAYFRITWNPAAPRGCIVFEFSGQEMPSATVFKTTGNRCPSFKEKPKKT